MAPPKQKGQKMGLGEFLTDSSLGSWADEMEDAPLPSTRFGQGSGHSDRFYQSGSSSTFQDRGYAVREPLPLPNKPPYTVHLGNMSFDATEGDIQELFTGCEVTSVRIVEDKIDRKPRGFGYAEFASVEGLKKALDFNGTQFQGRNIRVTVAEPQKDRSEAREISDWTRKGPLPDLPGQRRESGRPGFGGPGRGFDGPGRGFDGPNRSFDGPGRGFDGPGRGFEDGPGDQQGRRGGQFEQGDGKVRDFGNWERKGPLHPTNPAPPQQSARPSSNDGPRERRNSPAWGEGRSQDGSRPPRRDFSDRPAPERVPTAAEQDNQWRARMRPDPPAAPPATSPVPSSREPSVPSSPAAPAHAPLTTRPKLNLQKRTVSTADPSPTAAAAPNVDTRASPFGAARPIDTSAREKEIEEKLRVKKEQEEKAREERRLAKEAEKAQPSAQPQSPATSQAPAKGKSNGQVKDGEASDGGASGKNYQILRREEEAGNDASASNDDAPAIQVAPPSAGLSDSKKANGVENASGTTASAPKPTADDDGWNTVTKPQKKGKGGRS